MPIASIRRIAVAASVAALVAVPTTTSVAHAADQPKPTHAGDHYPHPPYYPPHGRLYVTRQTFACGGLSYVGTGFDRREYVTVKLDSVVLDTDQASRRGVVAGRVRVPCNTSPGRHTFSLTGQSSGQYLSANVRVRRLYGRAAEAASVKVDAAPMANHVTKAEKAPESSGPANAMSAVGAAAALGLVGAGTHLVLRRRRADNWRG